MGVAMNTGLGYQAKTTAKNDGEKRGERCPLVAFSAAKRSF
jgi:hypothetical protein